MAATHIPTKLIKAQGALITGQSIDLSSTTAFHIMAVKAGTGIPSTSSTGIQFVSDITATNAEDTLIGARQALSGVTWAFDASLGVVDWSFSNIVYPQAAGDDGLTRYFPLYAEGGGTDATRIVILIIDPGQLISVVNASLTIQSAAGGTIQMTGGG